MTGLLDDQTVLIIGRGSGIARAVAMAARDAGARVVTGQTLHIDGGEPLT